MVFTMGGKIAPSPSLDSSRSSVQRSAFSRAISRSFPYGSCSRRLTTASTAKKNEVHALRFGFGFGGLSEMRSWIDAWGGTGHFGRRALMMLSGTRIARDQDDIW